MDTCKVERCDRAVVFKRSQMCRQHRRQFLAGEPFREIQRKMSPGQPCAFGPCDEPSKNRGWCKSHYDQQLRGREMRMPKRYVPATSRDYDGNKWCGTCETWRPEADFASSSGKKDGLQTRCRSCNANIYRGRADLIRDKMRQYRFNLSREQFDAMFEAQGSACAICSTTEPGTSFWHVDHDHACCDAPGMSCGECIRGILCGACNTGIGQLGDDPDRLEAAARYIRSRSRTATIEAAA